MKARKKALAIAMLLTLVIGMIPGLAFAAQVGSVLAPGSSSSINVGKDTNGELILKTQDASPQGYCWPLRTAGRLSQGFSSGGHGGIDIAIAEGSDVIASMAGTVKYVQKNKGRTSLSDTTMDSYGNLVILYHPNGTATYYAHMKDVAVSAGNSVSQGQLLGHVGLTGATTGYHLHFELRTGATSSQNLSGQGTRQNPLNYVSSNNIYNPTPAAKAPSINAPVSIPGGADVTIKDEEGGATITYNLDSGAKSTFTGSKTIRVSKASTRFAAYATKSGRTQSSTTIREVKLSTTATPTLEKTNLAAGATITLDAAGNGETIYYTVDGTEPSFNVSNGTAVGAKYTSAFTLTQDATVKAIAVRSGELVSGKLSQSIIVVPPDAPTGLQTVNGATVAATKFAVDDAVTVKWAEDKAAASYTATLYNAKGEVVEVSSVKAAQAVFTPSVAGFYSVGVKAVNSVGASEESERVEFEAKDPCLVKFVDKETDENGVVTTKVLDKQLVRYGYSAETPAVPVKRGYTFAGWDKDTPLTNITAEEYEIIANWQINTYTVRFYKSDGKTLITTQSIEFGKSATPPEPPAPDAGYVFSGWTVTEADIDSARDYTNIDSRMSLKAVYAWADQELPVVVSITSAKRNERVYTVDVDVANNPTTATTAWLRVSLKTASGKLVQSTKETISLPAEGDIKSHRVTLKYEDGGYIASVAEAEVVGYSGDNRTGGAYSKAVTATIVSADDYVLSTTASAWSESAPAESEDYIIESETQYRYRDKQTTSNTATSLDGWTRDGTSSTSYGTWSANMTTTSKPTASDTLQLVGSPSTKYTYYRYCNYYDNQWQQDSIKYGSKSEYHEVTLTYAMTACPNRFGDQGGKASDLHGPYGSCSHKVSGQSFWWTKSIVTTYTYQTRTKTISYGYWKWGEWQDWTNEEAVANSDREVETRKVYRTRAKLFNDLTGTEDASGKTYSISGKFDSGMDVAGKEATIMVYNVTNSDPNEDQIQYIGQTVIGADGSYAFDFIPKKEPSAETGDFIVSLGVKGSTGLVNVDKIDAPANEHTVIYMYKNAQGQDVTVSEQKVADGTAAEVPDPPVVEGERFQRWSASTTSVTSDVTVMALYSTATYAVAWVDWVNGGVFLETKAYGDQLVAPVENPAANGYTFTGWDALLKGETTVTGNTVVNAVYEPQMYTVMFADAAGGVFATQQVAYGQAATVPETGPTAEGLVFVAWDTSAGTPWWNVTENMIVKPLFAYEGTVSSPFAKAEISSGFVSVKGKQVFLESATPGSTIYYTLDGSDPKMAENVRPQSALVTQADEVEEPVNTSMLYDDEQGITITEPCTIRAIAVMDEMNDSCVAEIPVDITATNDIANAEAGVAEAPFFYGEAVEPGIMVWLGDDLLVYGDDYTVEYSNNDGLGTATATLTGAGSYTGTKIVEFNIVEPPADDDNPGGSSSSGSASGGVNGETSGSASGAASSSAQKVVKKANPLVVKAKTPTVKYSKLKKKNQTIKVAKAFAVSKAQGAVTYKKVSGNKKITIASNGKITVKKGLKKKTYKVKVAVTAAGNSNFKPATKTVVLKIKIK